MVLMSIKFNPMKLRFFLEINFLIKFFVDYKNCLCAENEILFAKWVWRCMAGEIFSIENI
jgi:hypothetical protein